ncbi:MAG TPA: protease HtpX [Polyangiaceae bacterium]
MFKRFALLILTNFAVMAAISLVLGVLNALGVFGHGDFMRAYGPLIVLSCVAGFGGAFISLLASKWIAKWTTGARVIEVPRGADEAWLLQTVHLLSNRAGIGIPEVAIYESPELNAFATGASRNHSLVAVSSGLLGRMSRPEIEAVIGHELTHVANGDMVTLTLIQGVVNTFVIFLSRIIGNLVDRTLFRSEDGRGPAYFLSVIASQILLGILANMIVMAFSRWREFRADRGGAHLAGVPNMIAALEALRRSHEPLPAQQFASFGITGPVSRGIQRLFMSHPPLDERIAALRALTVA